MFEFVLPFMILIIVVVFVHEYGHYYFARRYGVGVTDFSIGFGKELFGWNDKSGTRWKICLIPLGGYVKFFGDRNVFSQSDRDEILKKYDEKDREELFTLKPLYQRAWIVFGGPLANFILAIFIFLMINIFVGKESTLKAIGDKSCILLNALTKDIHSGENPRYGRPGRIPNSLNIPFHKLVDSNTGKFKKPEEAAEIFNSMDISSDKTILNYCGGGIAATLDAFILYQLGFKNLQIYDNSMSEWAMDETLPIETDKL